jgi:hypothetical protein
MSAKRYLPAASSVARAIPDILARHGLTPVIQRYVLTETARGAAWLFIVLDVSPPERFVEAYAASDVMQDLSTALNGLPVVFNHLNGLCYAVLLSPSPDLKKAIPVPPPLWVVG